MLKRIVAVVGCLAALTGGAWAEGVATLPVDARNLSRKAGLPDGFSCRDVDSDDYAGPALKMNKAGSSVQLSFDGEPGELRVLAGINGDTNRASGASTVVTILESAEELEGYTEVWRSEPGAVLGEIVLRTLNEDSRYIRVVHEQKSQNINVSLHAVVLDKRLSVRLLPSFGEEGLMTGDEATITAAPGVAFGADSVEGVTYRWFVNGEEVAGQTDDTFVVDTTTAAESVTVRVTVTKGTIEASEEVTFAIRQAYAITYKECEGGTVSGAASAVSGWTVEVTATPEAGYQLVAIFVNGTSIGTATSFEMPTKAVEVSATFVLIGGDLLTREDTGAIGSQYKEWGPVAKPSGAEYSGNTAGGNTSIQMNPTQESGVVMTKGSGKNVAKVVLSWNPATSSDRVVRVYGQNTPYTGAEDLYDEATWGDFLGAVTNNGSTTFDVEAVGKYAYIGLNSQKGALYLDSISVTFNDEAAEPVIVGTVPESVDKGVPLEVQFVLANATATAWEADLGTITEDGLWTWTPDAALEFVLTVTARWDGGDMSLSYPIEVVDISAMPTYTKVEDYSTVSEDDYLIVATMPTGESYAMSVPHKSGTFPGAEVSISDGVIRTDDANIVWHLAPNEDNTGFSLYNPFAYDDHTGGFAGYQAHGSSNPFKIVTNANEYSYWAISASTNETGEVMMRNLGVLAETDGASTRFVRYNVSSPGFRTYKTEFSTATHWLFRLGDGTPGINGPTQVSGMEGDTLSATFGVKNLGELTVTSWGASAGSIADGVWTLENAEVGEFELTVTATLSDGKELTYSVPVEVAVRPVPHAITVACEGCTATASEETALAGKTITLKIVPFEGYSLTAVTLNGKPNGTSGKSEHFKMPDEDVLVEVTCKLNGGEPVLICSEGTEIVTLVNEPLELHFVLANTVSATNALIDDGSELVDGVIKDRRDESFVYAWTPTALGRYGLEFSVMDGTTEPVTEVIGAYRVTIEVTDTLAVSIKSITLENGTLAVELEDGTVVTDGFEYSTDLQTWSTELVPLTAPNVFVRLGAPPK